MMNRGSPVIDPQATQERPPRTAEGASSSRGYSRQRPRDDPGSAALPGLEDLDDLKGSLANICDAPKIMRQA